MSKIEMKTPLVEMDGDEMIVYPQYYIKISSNVTIFLFIIPQILAKEKHPSHDRHFQKGEGNTNSN